MPFLHATIFDQGWENDSFLLENTPEVEQGWMPWGL